MRLLKLSQYRAQFFALGSAPSMATLRRQIDRKELTGGTIHGGHYYIDLDVLDAETNLRAGIAARQDALAQHQALQGLV